MALRNLSLATNIDENRKIDMNTEQRFVFNKWIKRSFYCIVNENPKVKVKWFFFSSKWTIKS